MSPEVLVEVHSEGLKGFIWPLSITKWTKMSTKAYLVDILTTFVSVYHGAGISLRTAV